VSHEKQQTNDFKKMNVSWQIYSHSLHVVSLANYLIIACFEKNVSLQLGKLLNFLF